MIGNQSSPMTGNELPLVHCPDTLNPFYEWWAVGGNKV